MRILGIDAASVIGWSLIDGNNLIEFGSITIPSSFTLPQKLNFVHSEIDRVIAKTGPVHVAIEDIIMGISGVRTLTYLARINGICIQSAFSSIGDNISLYGPNVWKSNSFANISTKSPKWKIQVEACRYFNFNIDFKEFERIDQLAASQYAIIKDKDATVKQIKNEIDQCKKLIKRKRNPLTQDQKITAENKLKQLELAHTQGKIELKKLKKDIENSLSSIGNDIYSKTGISSDIADSIGVAVCAKNNL